MEGKSKPWEKILVFGFIVLLIGFFIRHAYLYEGMLKNSGITVGRVYDLPLGTRQDSFVQIGARLDSIVDIESLDLSFWVFSNHKDLFPRH